ncbi:MAG TPA: CPBP family intramembrane glutamic endopeptidase [Frankiaceae bacterium]|nr:CPBP family intramembrane glutamic endopeptidase [Frankiaceae bacterium]
MTRRRHLPVLAATVVVAAVTTRATFGAQPGSGRQAVLTYVLVAVLLLGAYASGGWPVAHRRGRRPVVAPALTGVLLFLAFTVLAIVTSWIGPFTRDVTELARHLYSGAAWDLVLGATLAGVAEEVFYRGAVFERFRRPVLTATLTHMAATLLVGNVALTLAAGVLGVVLGLSRRASGGWWAPAVTHVVWCLLMLRWLPT